MFENDTESTVKVAPIVESFQQRGLRNDTESSRMRKIFFLAKRHQALAVQHPQLILLAVTFFFVTFGSGIAIATVYANVEQDELEANALAIAMETGRFFSHHLDRAILPLFSLAQFVREIQEFRELPDLIGLSNAEGSLPFLPPAEGLDRPTHRNVTGVCDDPPILARYTRIAGAIKEDADMDGVLVNLQLVPDGVVCLVHPVNNTEDFPPGVHLDSTVSIGHDLLYDPERKFMAEATVASDEVVIVGPIKLLQCPREDCDPLVEKAFIARLPILSKTNEIFVNGESHLRWGFAVALINWNVLVENSGIYDEFEKSNLEFQLTRTDYIPNPDDGTIQKIVSSGQRFSPSRDHERLYLINSAPPPTPKTGRRPCGVYRIPLQFRKVRIHRTAYNEQRMGDQCGVLYKRLHRMVQLDSANVDRPVLGNQYPFVHNLCTAAISRRCHGGQVCHAGRIGGTGSPIGT